MYINFKVLILKDKKKGGGPFLIFHQCKTYKYGATVYKLLDIFLASLYCSTLPVKR